MIFEDIGVRVPEVMLPKTGVDLKKWAVIACDQYLSQPEYWDDVEKYVDGSPSTLHLILPEARLDCVDLDEKAKEITSVMDHYLDEGILIAEKEGFVLVERVNSEGKVRKGLIVALDLEHYDYEPGSKKLIRTTEGTYLDKVHPRVKIREKAKIESPHILVLIDDPDKTVIEPLFEKKLRQLYDFKLMKGGGSIKGYKIDDMAEIKNIAQRLRDLIDPDTFNKRYGVSGKKPFLYAMGDGNHSFATAQLVWKKVKENAQDKQAIMNHPARWALVELLNVHDDGLSVEPIHRTVTNVDLDDILSSMKKFFEEKGMGFQTKELDSYSEVEEILHQKTKYTHYMPYIHDGKFGLATIVSVKYDMEVESLEAFLEEYLKDKKGSKLNFIHGEDVVTKLCCKPGLIGFYFPKVAKHDIFRRVVEYGPFHRKSISMGHAADKKFYLECRKIK